MTRLVVLFGIDTRRKNMFCYLCGMGSNLSGSCEQIRFCPSFNINGMLMVGGHMFGDSMIGPGKLVSQVQCYTAMVMINLYGFIIIPYFYFFACIAIGYAVVMMVFR